MVQAYAARDRVASMHLDDTRPDANAILNIPVQNYLPSPEDHQLLYHEYINEVQKILCAKMEAFKDVNLEPMQHPYMQELSQKSHMVPLGVIDKDETKITNMIDIVETYQQLVPLRDGKLVTTILYGDGLSCERVNDAKCARISSANPMGRLDGIEPQIQEWHRRAIHLNDIYSSLFSGKSARDKGTLFYLKSRFRHRNVSANVMHCFNYANELMRFTTEAYAVAAACSFLGLNAPDDCLPNQPSEPLELEHLLLKTAKHVVGIAFCPPDASCIINAAAEEPELKYCLCQEELEDAQMVKCENKKCRRGQWFHLKCIDLAEEDLPDGDWFCSQQCNNKKMKTAKPSATEDHKFQYSKAVLWYGLGDSVRTDAVRQGDGNRIIMHWRQDMVHFFEGHHTKYFVFGHRLLTSTGGGASERIAHQLTWNRTVNPSGLPGRNLEMDLQMEFYNKAYKESIKSAGGHITDNTVRRHGDMVGLGRSMQLLFDLQVAERRTDKRKHGQADRSPDFKDLVELLLEEE
ncbi:PREDICTED: uncharacterized protein LOC106813035 [Priapulus caudatus]|uniref:Uncharacterized protein LOC106813035 n=1 Tax=Priapulus caudatus TaxID=37621 RepID=A0ABM1EK46_PRICU|nr:PREDICTED: uncharacterized protein LOC106813035 [Priapulus caudatus]